MRQLAVALAVLGGVGCSNGNGYTSNSSTGQRSSAAAGSSATTSGSATGATGAGTQGVSTTAAAGSSGSSGNAGSTGGASGGCPSECFAPYPVCGPTHTCLECNQDSDCSSGVCFNTFCVDCDAAHPCSGGQQCEQNACIGSCLTTPCPTNQIGETEFCQPSGQCLECLRASDCQTPLICLDGGSCGTCATDTDCHLYPDGGQACSDGACLECHVGAASDPLCPDGGACNQEGICCGTPGFPC